MSEEAVVPQEQSLVKPCSKCGKDITPETTSRIDPNLCQECCSDVVVTDTTFVKTHEEFDESTDTLIRETKKCRQLIYGGADWVFFTKAIATLSDEQLKTSIEYHRAMVIQMELEITERKVKNTKIAIRVGGATLKIERTTEKHTRTKTTQKKFDPAAIAAQIKSGGLSLEQILKALGVKNASSISEVAPTVTAATADGTAIPVTTADGGHNTGNIVGGEDKAGS